MFAYDMGGTLLWKKPNGFPRETTKAFGNSYIGSRSSPTYNDGVVYHLDEFIQLTAFDSGTGERIWYLNLSEFFDAELPDWGFSESILIEGNTVYSVFFTYMKTGNSIINYRFPYPYFPNCFLHKEIQFRHVLKYYHFLNAYQYHKN